MIALEIHVHYDVLHHWECVRSEDLLVAEIQSSYIGRIPTTFNEVSC